MAHEIDSLTVARVAYRVFLNGANMVPMEIAQPIVGDLGFPTEYLYGPERGEANGERFRSLLKDVLAKAQAVTTSDVEQLVAMSAEDAIGYARAVSDITSRVIEVVGLEEDPWGFMSKLTSELDVVACQANQVIDGGGFKDPARRYRAVGEMGKSLLDTMDEMEPLLEGIKANWSG